MRAAHPENLAHPSPPVHAFPVIASEAKQSPSACTRPEGDCFVAALLAMTT
jgi:hypothetical protein